MSDTCSEPQNTSMTNTSMTNSQNSSDMQTNSDDESEYSPTFICETFSKKKHQRDIESWEQFYGFLINDDPELAYVTKIPNTDMYIFDTNFFILNFNVSKITNKVFRDTFFTDLSKKLCSTRVRENYISTRHDNNYMVVIIDPDYFNKYNKETNLKKKEELSLISCFI